MDLQDQIKVSLEESQLWEKFAVLTNEMIVTKNGRRMFPVIKLNLSGLEPNTLYKVWLEFRQIENNRYKYINGEWHPGNYNSYNFITSLFTPRHFDEWSLRLIFLFRAIFWFCESILEPKKELL